jgi:SAM-dependent methyltransferase
MRAATGIADRPPVSAVAPDRDIQARLLRLYRVSVLKQQKWLALRRAVGPTGGLRGLDIGGDNGIISYLLRRQGGAWTSADLDAQTVEAIRTMVGERVISLAEKDWPYPAGSFDRVVFVDCLEHVRDDGRFVEEACRVLAPGGRLIINVPLRKNSWLRRVREAIGQTDEAHGHLRPGYTVEELRALIGPRGTLLGHRTYSKFFSQLVDTVMTAGIRALKKPQPGAQVKGTVVTGQDARRHETLFRLYRLAFPLLWLVAQLDCLLWWRSGYMLLATVEVGGEQGGIGR